MTVKAGLNWDNIDLNEVIEESARWLRRAMRYSDDSCEVKKRVDAKLLETLWCPSKETDNPIWLSKDVVRDDLKSLGTPKGFWADTCKWEFKADKCPQCYVGGLLARVLLGPMDWLFRLHPGASGESQILWVVAKLYDQLGGINFYRTLSGMGRDEQDYRIGQLLFRIPEAEYEWFKSHIADFSTLLRDNEKWEEVDYCLICKKNLSSKASLTELRDQISLHDVSDIMDSLVSKCDSLRAELAEINTIEVSEQLSSRILSRQSRVFFDETLGAQKREPANMPMGLNNISIEPLDNSLVRGTIEKAIKVLSVNFFNPVLRPLEEGPLKIALSKLIANIKKKTKVVLLQEDEYWKLANYFIWLKTLHKDLGSYTVRYAANYRLMPDTDHSTQQAAFARIQNSCFVIASHKLPSSQLLADARVSLTHCLGPLEDYYAIKQARKNSRADIGAGMFHNLAHFTSPLSHYGSKLISKNLTSTEQHATVVRISNTTRRLQKFISSVMALIKDTGDLKGLKSHTTENLKGIVEAALAVTTFMVEAEARDLAECSTAPLSPKVRTILRYLHNSESGRGFMAEERQNLHAWLKNVFANNTILKDWLPAEPDVNTLITWWQCFGLNFRIEGNFTDLHGPRQILIGVLEECLLNSLTATAMARPFWGDHITPIRIEADTNKNAFRITNLSSQEFPTKSLLERPQGDAGWGLYACQLLMKHIGGNLKAKNKPISEKLWMVSLTASLPQCENEIKPCP